MQVHPTKFLPTSTENTANPVLICPICGDEYVHPIRVDVVSPGKRFGKVSVDSDGIHLNPEHPPLGRGCIVYLEFQCESGHRYYHRLEFDKGRTVATLLARNTTDDKAGPIWRE